MLYLSIGVAIITVLLLSYSVYVTMKENTIKEREKSAPQASVDVIGNSGKNLLERGKSTWSLRAATKRIN